MPRFILLVLVMLSLFGCGLGERRVDRPRNYDWVRNMSDEDFRLMMTDLNQGTQRDILHELQFQSQIQMMPVWVDVWK